MDKPLKFYGFLHGLSMENRTRTNDPGKTWYNISVRLMAARECAGMDYSDLAEKLGCHRTSVMRWETEEIRSIDNDRIKQWAKICGVTPEWLINGGPSGNYKIDMKATATASYRYGVKKGMGL